MERRRAIIGAIMITFAVIIAIYFSFILTTDPYSIGEAPITIIVLILTILYSFIVGIVLLWRSRTKYILKAQEAKERKEKEESSKSVWAYCEWIQCVIILIIIIIAMFA
ncbi:MAG: hypothetical protein EU531_05370 [Promethearchaeota archaeon]|nr:MAG: hypothetical protein EU531_05370 [Candidatus Lokiarchaeota archaeon]